MANAKFIQTSSGVTLEFDNDMGERVTRRFFVAGSKGGYVKEWDNRGGLRRFAENCVIVAIRWFPRTKGCLP